MDRWVVGRWVVGVGPLQCADRSVSWSAKIDVGRYSGAPGRSHKTDGRWQMADGTVPDGGKVDGRAEGLATGR